MKGKILGVATAEAQGVITGEDGKRYRYALSDWKGARETTIGMQVDFDAHDGQASDVYPALSDNVLGSISAPNLEGLTGSPVVAKLKQLVTGTLAFPLAVIVLVAFLLPALSLTEETVNQLGLAKLAKTTTVELANRDFSEEIQSADARIAEQQQLIETNRQRSGPYGPMFDEQDLREGLKAQEEQKAKIIEARGKAGYLKSVIAAFPVRYLALAAALWLLWSTWVGRAVKLPSLVTGALAIGAGVLPLAFKSVILAANEAGAITTFMDKAQLDAAISVGFGTWVLLAAGVALIAAGLGLVRNPLAKSQS